MNKDIMESLVGKILKVDRGPESRIGKVMGVGEDYFVLLTKEDKLVYYSMHQVKSITKQVKTELDFNIEVPECFKFKRASTFEKLLHSLKFQMVKVNCGGPEEIEGILGEVNKDYVLLINKETIYYLQVYHIRNISFQNISYGLKVEMAKDEKSENQLTVLTEDMGFTSIGETIESDRIKSLYKEYIKPEKVTTFNKEIISKTIQIPESESFLGGSALIEFINITKLIEVNEQEKKRVFLIDLILPSQILELKLKSKRCDSE